MNYFTDNHFLKYSRFIYEKFGIHLTDNKRLVLQSKIDKLMGKNNISSYEEYYRMLTQCGDRQYLLEFASEITINKTDFFRENNHFEFIRNNLNFITGNNPRIRGNRELRVWSAGCSTGEEPYTLAMVLKECMPEEIRIKILATDVSSKVLVKAQKGIYHADIRNDVEGYYLNKYFKKTAEGFLIKEDIREMVTFRMFNLMEPFPFKDTFDIIFCRNVVIYFDASTQQSLLDKFYEVMTLRGLLFIGHSESLSGKKHRFQYIQPTIYMK